MRKDVNASKRSGGKSSFISVFWQQTIQIFYSVFQYVSNVPVYPPDRKWPLQVFIGVHFFSIFHFKFDTSVWTLGHKILQQSPTFSFTNSSTIMNLFRFSLSVVRLLSSFVTSCSSQTLQSYLFLIKNGFIAFIWKGYINHSFL